MCLVIFLSRNQPARLDMLQSELVTVQRRIQPQQRKALFQLYLMAGKLFRCEKKNVLDVAMFMNNCNCWKVT